MFHTTEMTKHIGKNVWVCIKERHEVHTENENSKQTISYKRKQKKKKKID